MTFIFTPASHILVVNVCLSEWQLKWGNIEFLYQLLIRFDIKRLSFGTGQPLVKASELKRLELMMPTDMEEQMRIGVYFKNLDHLITLHQCEFQIVSKRRKARLRRRAFEFTVIFALIVL